MIDIRRFADDEFNYDINIDVKSDTRDVDKVIQIFDKLENSTTRYSRKINDNFKNMLGSDATKVLEKRKQEMDNILSSKHVGKTRLGKQSAMRMINDSATKDLESIFNKNPLPNGIFESLTYDKSTAKGFNIELGKIINNAKQAKMSINDLSDVIKSSLLVQVESLYKTLRRTFSWMEQAFVAAGDYVESINLYTMSVGKYADAGEKWAERISDALYLDTSEIYQYTGQFYNLTKGLGASAEAADLMSRNLTQLSYDMSSYLNIDVSVANNKLMSAMSGQTKAVTSVGIAVQSASLQELAYELGIQKSVRTMTQAEKTYLRYIQIMRTTTQMQGDLGRTIITPTNAMRLLRTQLLLLARAIGQVLTPFVMEAIPYIIAFTQVLQDAAKTLAGIFGYDIKDYLADASAIKDMSDWFDDLGLSAEDAAGKIHSTLAPFDELNVVASKSSGMDDSSNILAEMEKYISGYDMLAAYNEETAKQVAEIKKSMANLLPIIVTIGGAFAAWKGIKAIGSLKALLAGSGGASTGLLATLGLTMPELLAILAAVAVSVGGMVVELPKVSNAFADIYKNGKSFKDVLKDFSAFDAWLISVNLMLNPMFTLGVLVTNTKQYIEALNSTALKSTDVLEDMGDELSETSKVNMKPIVSGVEDLTKSINKIAFNDKIINDDDVEEIKGKVNGIKDTIVNQLDTNKNKELANLKTLEGALGTDRMNELNGKIESFYSTQISTIQANSDRINEIYRTAASQNRKLTEEEEKEIVRLKRESYDIGIKNAAESSDEYYLVMSKLDTNLRTLNVEHAADTIKSAIELRDKTIKNAEEQYDGIKANALKMLDAGKITKDEYDEIVKAAETTKINTIDEANKQYDGIVQAVEDKLPSATRFIDTETGKMRTHFEVFKYDTIRKFNETFDGIKTAAGNIWTNVKTKFEEFKTNMSNFIRDHIAPMFTKDYWVKKFNGLADGAKSVLDSTKKKFEEFMPKMKTPEIKWVEGGIKATGWMKDALEALNLPTSLPKLSIKWFEEGGFPTSGDLFWANENGAPEMVGRIGNKTAVANNEQITKAITDALLQALGSMNLGNNEPRTTVVNIGNRKVYEGIGTYVDGENDRYGTNYVTV